MAAQLGGRGPAQATGDAASVRPTRSMYGAHSGMPAFVGRDNVLASIVGALTDGPSLVLVEGEPGIGKTRLLRECLNAPELADRTVLVAACPPLAEPFPLGPIVDGLRRLRQRVGVDVELSALGGALRPLFPDWADELPPALEALEDPKETRHRLLSALTELVERLGVEVLVVEDAHWADAATLEWLLTRTTGEPVAGPGPARSIVVTYRPTDVPEGSLLPRLTSRPSTGMSQLRVELEPLDVQQTRHLVGSMLATGEVSEEFAVFLHDHTDGVPLALEETIRLMRERHDIIRQHGSWSRKVLDELDVPPTVRDSVLERVDWLEPTARRVLEAAAILAAPADEPLLAIVAGLDEQAGRRGVAAALASGLLQETGPGRFVFRHALDAQAVGDAIPVSERRRQHRRAGTALEQLDRRSVQRLAYHFRESGDTEQWCHYAEAAADLALEAGDDRTAVVTLLDVLNTVEHPLERRVRLARKLGEAAFFGASALGDLAEQVVGVLREALSAGDLPRGGRGELRLLLGRMLWDTGGRLASLEENEAAIPDLDHRPDLAIRAMTNLALPDVPDWPASRHLRWLDRATELAQRSGSSADRLVITARRATAFLFLGNEKGWAAVREIHESTPAPTEQRLVARELLNVAWATLPWGRYDETRRQMDLAVQQIQSAGFQRHISSARLARQYLDWYTGQWRGLDTAAAELVAAEESKRVDQLQARQLLGLLALVSGARAKAERWLEEIPSGYARLAVAQPEAVPAPAALGRLCLADGTAEKALQVTAPAVEMIAQKGVWLWATDIAPVHLDALIRAGRLTEADTWVAEFRDGVRDRDAPAPAAAVVTCRAILAEARGDVVDAGGLFAEAALAWAALPRPYDELLSQERQGRALLAAGKQDEAGALLSNAQQRLRELGASWDADRVARLLREHGVDVPRAWRGGRHGYGDQLSPRELEVVDLAARGMTNRQIADTLFISPKTVARHLTVSMRKLDVSSRTALAMAAAEAGLLSTDDRR